MMGKSIFAALRRGARRLAYCAEFSRPVICLMCVECCDRFRLSCATAPVWAGCAQAVTCVQGRLLPGALLVPPRQL